MNYMSDLLGPSDARALLDRHDGDHSPTAEECEDYITSPDFWHDHIAELAPELIHLMTVIQPVSFMAHPPTIQELCDRWGDLVALKQKAMQQARDAL